MNKPMLQVRGLRKVFQTGGFFFQRGQGKVAVQAMDFDLHAGETLAIVGESGSGKSTAARLAMRLLEPSQGEVSWAGTVVTNQGGKVLRQQRKMIQMVFQDPFASLNPKMKIVDTVAEGLKVHQPQLRAAERRERVKEMLATCGLDEEVLDRYPHQFSGGQRQRIGIARALITEPDVLVLDEPVSALDVSVQAQVLNLLKKLQVEKGLAYLFISHDLSVVQHIADRVIVMFAGFVVEEGDVNEVFAHPKHPYTQSLLEARPISHPSQRQPLQEIDLYEGVATEGCVFSLRCSRVQEACKSFDMTLDKQCACLFPLEVG